MKHLIILIISFLFNTALAQSGKLIIGECLEDEHKPEYTEFIDADSSGIYFLKTAKEKGKTIHYVDKYDANSLKLIYRCILPQIFKDNIIIRRFYYNREYYTMLKNGHVDLLFASQEGKNHNIYHLRVDRTGNCIDQPQLAYSIAYKNKVSKRKAKTEISNNREYLFLLNEGETKKINEICCLKIMNDENFNLVKHYTYQLKASETLNTQSLWSFFNDGRIGGFFNPGGNDRVTMLNASGKILNKDISDITQTTNYVSNIALWNFINKNCDIKYDTNFILTVFDKKNERYGFIDVSYDHAKNNLNKNSTEYLNDENTARLKGTMGEFNNNLEWFMYKQIIETKDYTYKIISKQYEVVINFVLQAQSYLIVFIYSKANKLVGQKIIPINFRHIAKKDYDKPKGEKLTEFTNINYGTIVVDNTLYFLTNENWNNGGFSPDKGPLADFNVCKELKGSRFCCYKLNPNEPIKRIETEFNPSKTVFNIVNNFRHFGSYQYVYVKVKDKLTLGKIVIE